MPVCDMYEKNVTKICTKNMYEKSQKGKQAIMFLIA